MDSFDYDVKTFKDSKLIDELKNINFDQKTLIFIPNLFQLYSEFYGYKKYSGWNIVSFSQNNEIIKMNFKFSDPGFMSAGTNAFLHQTKNYFVILDKFTNDNIKFEYEILE
ncbi:hypothetical protein [Mycoplasma leonicaptivi]|uniref:hypothetical protein n=1 Tax=Mycoplasma leonicaptivi TaxID=36742 RepID=UPI000488D83F|nr:hypothetical protein [Mycoplasma leonicaptivi]